jgi:hypothetical protein
MIKVGSQKGGMVNLACSDNCYMKNTSALDVVLMLYGKEPVPQGARVDFVLCWIVNIWCNVI